MDVTPFKPYGWGKSVRLRKHAQFSRVQSKGHRIGGKFLLVIFAPSSFLDVRFGLTVSKHVGHAVTRNRVKRRLRDILRHHKSALSGMGLDIVWIARNQAAMASYASLREEVLYLIGRIIKSCSCTR